MLKLPRVEERFDILTELIPEVEVASVLSTKSVNTLSLSLSVVSTGTLAVELTDSAVVEDNTDAGVVGIAVGVDSDAEIEVDFDFGLRLTFILIVRRLGTGLSSEAVLKNVLFWKFLTNISFS
jgi:hypothetical protein